MGKPKVNQESQRALVQFLRERDTDPGHLVIVNAYADALEIHAQFADTPAEHANRRALGLSCMCLAVHWKDDDAFREEWTPPTLRAAG